MKKNDRSFGFGGVGALLVLLATQPSFGAGNATRVFLRGQVPPAVARLRAMDGLPAARQLQVSIGLPVRNPAGLSALLHGLYDPASASYHHYLTPQQFAQSFGPSAADYQTVIDYATRHGLQVAGVHASHLVLDVVGSVADIENTFQVKLRVYPHPKESRTFFAPDAEPSVDASLPVRLLSISGLDNYFRTQPASLHFTPSSGPPGATPDAGTGSGPGGTYMGHDFRQAYLPGNKLNGSGQSVALLEFDGYYASDIAAYETAAKLPPVPLTNVAVNGGVGSPGSGEEEVALDIEMAISMATNVTQVLVYEAPGGTAWPTILSQIADDNLAGQISCSWYSGGGGPDPASEQIFQQMAAQGQSFLTSSGDADAYVGAVSFPDDSPNITIVGGTTLTTVARSGGWSSESAWNRGLDTTSGQYVGTGGGISSSYPIPFWQQGVNSFLTNGGSPLARNVPDVALTADNIYVYHGNGQKDTVGGTSCAAPLWAGLLALVNQQAVAAGQPVVGFINPAIYEIANESIYAAAFHDITTGSNAWANSPNAFYAVPGYDLCTGLGTPKGSGLINALVSPDPLIIVSNGGFYAVGTPAGTFNLASQTYYLTNSSASTLTWSLLNTSVWLSASATGGQLVAGASASVVIGLNAAASNLIAGTYTANLWFSNATSHVGHSRFFTLTTSDPLVLLPPTSLFFSGPPGGPFAAAPSAVTLTNASNSNLNWAMNSSSAWLAPSPASGSLFPGAQATVTFNPTLAAANLLDGYYPTVFQVTNLASQFVQVVTGVVNVGIVENGGFETGDFTGWTFVGNTSGNGSIYNGVVGVNSLADGSGPNFIHSGNYGLFLGDTNLATVSQILQTTPGQTYRLSFWLDNPTSGAGQQFLVNWITNSAGTNQLYLRNDPPVFAWMNLVFTVQATETNTLLQFGAENPPDGFGLDDISLVALAAPVFTSQPTNQTVLVGNPAALSGTVRGIAPLAFQWFMNGTNLASAAAVAGATSNVLVFSPAAFANSGGYSLVVTNNYGAVTSSLATLTVVLPPGFSNVVVNPDGSCRLNLLGTPQFTYVLAAATNLAGPANWQPVATNTLNSSGLWQFTDAAATNFPQRFYQLQEVP